MASPGPSVQRRVGALTVPHGCVIRQTAAEWVLLTSGVGASRRPAPLYPSAATSFSRACGGSARVLSGVPPHVEQSLFYRCPQSSSASRFTAGAAGFLNLSQSGVRPER